MAQAVAPIPIPITAEVAATLVVPAANWTLFRSLPTFDLRNGDVSDVTPVLMKATIPTAYKWVPVDVLAPEHHVKAIDASIRSHLVHVSDNPIPNTNEAQARKAAIVMGVTRAVATTFYRLGREDLIPGEVVAPLLSADAPVEGVVTSTVVPGYSGDHAALLTAPLELTNTEEAAVCAIVKCAAGVIAMQGYSLTMTNHHYLSANDSQSRKVFAVAEKAYWKSTDVASWFSDDLEKIQDWMWHKATHPVHITVKTRAAMDSAIKEKLTAAGSGACASRLPAIETELRAAQCYVQLYSTVAPMFVMFGGSLDISALNDMIEIVKSLPPGIAAPPIPAGLPESLRGIVTNRLTALKYLGSMLKRNADSAAFCYGFYMALAEANAALGALAPANLDTLKTSYSLTKLRQQSYASYVEGTQSYGDYAAVRTIRRQRGEFDPPRFQIR